MTQTELTPQEVERRVWPYVLKMPVGDITLQIADIQLRNGYWRILIRPSREPKPLVLYFEALADLEEEIQENEGIKVSISPGDPLTE